MIDIEALLADAIGECEAGKNPAQYRLYAKACLRTLAEHGYHIVGPVSEDTSALENGRKAVVAALGDLAEWLGFSTSVIRSGEAWSGTCEQMRAKSTAAIHTISDALPMLEHGPVEEGEGEAVARAIHDAKEQR